MTCRMRHPSRTCSWPRVHPAFAGSSTIAKSRPKPIPSTARRAIQIDFHPFGEHIGPHQLYGRRLEHPRPFQLAPVEQHLREPRIVLRRGQQTAAPRKEYRLDRRIAPLGRDPDPLIRTVGVNAASDARASGRRPRNQCLSSSAARRSSPGRTRPATLPTASRPCGPGC